MSIEDQEFSELLGWVIQHNLSAKPKDKIIVDMDKGIADYATIRHSKELGRNDECKCGSGKKYKKCCIGKVNQND